jgi:hypothetical protein
MLKPLVALAVIATTLTPWNFGKIAINTANAKAAPGTSVPTWQMPWQLNPIAKSPHGRERIYKSYIKGTGSVRGTRQALRSIGHPLPHAHGLNRTVNACRAVVASVAKKDGAKQVEAASAGPDHVNAKGHYVGNVLFRINYHRHHAFEVRQAMLVCVVDRHLKIVDAFPPHAKNTRYALEQ